MNSFFKIVIAGFGAYKLGGGIIGTILVFVFIYLFPVRRMQLKSIKSFKK